MIFLASQSPRRQQILSQADVPFQVVKSSFCESGDIINPEERALFNARGKAKNTQKKSGIVLGIDTFGYQGDLIFEKPHGRDEAYTMLQRLSGKTHVVISGVCFWDVERQKEEHFVVKTEVLFFDLSDQEIREYLQTNEYLDKSCSYSILEGKSKFFVRGISGDFWNVVGFPLEAVYRCKRC